jgi:hypothetical protein
MLIKGLHLSDHHLLVILKLFAIHLEAYSLGSQLLIQPSLKVEIMLIPMRKLLLARQQGQIGT